MEWVLFVSLQWVVYGSPTPSNSQQIGRFASEELCKKAAEAIKADIAKSGEPGRALPLKLGTGFDPLDPSNMSPLVVALSADDAQNITGQVFHVWGGAINALQGWSAGELFESDERWDADALLGELVGRFPDGAAPPGMMAGMQAAGGRSLRAQ